MWRALLCLICLLVLVLPVAAEVRIITLQHRAAEEMVAKIEPLLDQGEKVQAAGDHLVLIADGESLQAVESLIALLDRELLSLDIRVRQGERQQQAGEDTSAKITLNTQNSSSMAATSARHLGNSNQEVEQVLRVLEGESGWLEVGRDVPYTSEWAAFSGESAGYAARIDYQKIAIGFWVHPVQVKNGQFLVEIMPQFSRIEGRKTDPPEIRFSEFRTRLNIPLGEWVPLAQQIQQSNRVSRAILSWHAGGGRSEQDLFIRIDPAKGFSP